MISLYATLAFASEPVITKVAPGLIVGTMEMEASESEVRSALADAAGSLRLVPEVLSVQSAIQGRCASVTVETKGMWDPLRYTALRCPTSTGWKLSLVESTDFNAMELEWRLNPTSENRTMVEYRIKTDTNLPAPQALVDESVKISARTTLKALLAKIFKNR